MDYKELYEQALERAQELIINENGMVRVDRPLLEQIFPELKESEDEKIRKKIIALFKGQIPFTSEEDNKKFVAWLEKQDNTIPDECVFRPAAGCDIESAAKQAIKQQGVLAKKVVLAFNGAYIPVGGKATDIIVNEYNSWLEKQGGITKLSEEKQEITMAKINIDKLIPALVMLIDEPKYSVAIQEALEEQGLRITDDFQLEEISGNQGGISPKFQICDFVEYNGARYFISAIEDGSYKLIGTSHLGSTAEIPIRHQDRLILIINAETVKEQLKKSDKIFFKEEDKTIKVNQGTDLYIPSEFVSAFMQDERKGWYMLSKHAAIIFGLTEKEMGIIINIVKSWQKCDTNNESKSGAT